MEKLISLLTEKADNLTIALSGGVDSLTLMRVAAEVRTAQTTAVHAVSAAVPSEATTRCRELAAQYNWQLIELDAGEFADNRYRSNPVNRCYYCKSNLFDSMVTHMGDNYCIATGTNTDDLGDYRPGLEAARERGIWQPYVEAGVSKSQIRKIALQFGLKDESQLPAQPCLSSRIETGIVINTDDLSFVHRMERQLSHHFGDGDIRCRIVSDGVVVQLPATSPVFKEICQNNARQLVTIQPYKMGSAFVHPAHDSSDV